VWLEVVKGPDQGQKLIVFEKDCVIGRDPKFAQILIKNDPMVGRRHARLFEDDQGHYVLEDLKSQNGLMVNGVRISEPVTLQSEDKIIVGLTELLFVDQT
jgi:pSer/pThr/pTyr-binding forkhead associated (FHA) protein